MKHLVHEIILYMFRIPINLVIAAALPEDRSSGCYELLHRDPKPPLEALLANAKANIPEYGDAFMAALIGFENMLLTEFDKAFEEEIPPSDIGAAG